MDWTCDIFETLLPIMKGEREENGGDFNLRVGTEGNQRDGGRKDK